MYRDSCDTIPKSQMERHTAMVLYLASARLKKFILYIEMSNKRVSAGMAWNKDDAKETIEQETTNPRWQVLLVFILGIFF